MSLVNRIRRYVVLPALLSFLAAGLGAPVSSARTQRKSSGKRHHVTAANWQRSHAPQKTRKRRYSRRHRRYRGQRAPTRERISEIQTALSKDGSYVGEPSGKMDANTAEALRKFQAAHGLNPTGKFDALTLQKLGLGSETAGIAPPLPPIGSALADPARAATQTNQRQ
jgi:peptidoglycan hydrolase-like protein with peptidoglycan-binding domain